LLHSNIAFPLLKALAGAGDAKAMRVAREEVAGRIKDGTTSTRLAILESYPELLDPALFESLLGKLSNKDRHSIASSWSRQGNTLKDLGQHEGALEAYKVALRLEPCLTEYWFDICFDIQTMGDTQTVIDACRKAIAVDIDKELTWRMLLVKFRDLGDMQGFIGTCKKLFSINPVGENAWLRIRGLWLSFIVDLKDFCGIQSVLDVCRESIPNLTSHAKSYLLFRIDEVLGAKGDLDGAIDAYRKSLDSDPLQKDRNVVWRYLGDALKAIGDERGADDAYIKAGLSPPRLDGLFG
jgi:tetratricopeptide (TPR) repeat protein